MRIRDVEAADLAGVLVLNNEHAAEVNSVTAEQLARQVGIAAAARIVDDGAMVSCAFLIAFDEKTPVQGPNHAWFIAERPAFLYVDRVVVAAAARGRGLARALYEDLESRASGRPICCEVYSDPPNVVSLAFHERLGFSACGEATDPRTGKRVRYLIRTR